MIYFCFGKAVFNMPCQVNNAVRNFRGIAGLEIVCANMENNVGGGGHFT